MQITNLNGINRVRFNDYSDYVSDKCNNGGCYGFWTDYNRVDKGWEVSHWTTAEFDYCPVCGSFNNHYVGDEGGEYSCGENEIITEKELLKKIESFEETEDCYIELKFINITLVTRDSTRKEGIINAKRILP